ncbi:hypothetical protein GOODEAATRI_009843, partial [Goodea atripinnis]
TSFMSDFDVMLAKRKAMNSRKRRHRDGGTFISDADDVVSAMITKMNEAAEPEETGAEETYAVAAGRDAPQEVRIRFISAPFDHRTSLFLLICGKTQRICSEVLLPCLSLRQDLKETFIDSGVMSAIKEWISPLPDKSLPALRIREELLRILQELPNVSQETLKHSGIGRAVMFLYKHPKESRANKDLALKLISKNH